MQVSLQWPHRPPHQVRTTSSFPRAIPHTCNHYEQPVPNKKCMCPMKSTCFQYDMHVFNTNWTDAKINACVYGTGRGMTLSPIDYIRPGRIHVLIQLTAREFMKCSYRHTRHTLQAPISQITGRELERYTTEPPSPGLQSCWAVYIHNHSISKSQQVTQPLSNTLAQVVLCFPAMISFPCCHQAAQLFSKGPGFWLICITDATFFHRVLASIQIVSLRT